MKGKLTLGQTLKGFTIFPVFALLVIFPMECTKRLTHHVDPQLPTVCNLNWGETVAMVSLKLIQDYPETVLHGPLTVEQLAACAAK